MPIAPSTIETSTTPAFELELVVVLLTVVSREPVEVVDDEIELVRVVVPFGATVVRYPAAAIKTTTVMASPAHIVLLTKSSCKICKDQFERFFHSLKKTEVLLTTFNIRRF